MTSVNELNAITRTRKELQEQLHSRFGALLIAVYKLPLEYRIEVMEQYETNYQNMVQMKELLQSPVIKKYMEPEKDFVEQQDTQEADWNRTQAEERLSDQFDHPKD